MVGSKYILFLVLGLFSLTGLAQTNLWSEVSVNKKSVYQGEPVEVTVSVFTETWFTQGVNVQNIQVNNAFTVYFRSLSTSRIIKGKTYAGVQFFYHVFPYTSNNVEFPSLEILVETPNVGDYKGVERKVRTQAKIIMVKPIPSAFDADQWLVTNSCVVKDKWSRSLKNIKVGDVIERSINRAVSGTVSELIPPVVWDAVNGVSLYIDRSITQNNKSKTDISATRTDKMRYLFEEEGQVIIPEMTFLWWNPVRKKVFKRTLKEVVIDVAPNPDLGILETIKDSLNIVTQRSQEAEEKEGFLLWGTPLDEWLKRVLVAVLMWVLVVRVLVPISNNIRSKYRRYRNSERYYFNQIIWVKLGGFSSKLEHNQYRWLDELELEESTISFFWERFGGKSSRSIIGWFKARKKYFCSLEKTKNSDWINPE